MTVPCTSTPMVPDHPERAQLVAEIEGADLEEWARLWAIWLAQHPRARKRRQAEVASILAGRSLGWGDLQELRFRKPFQAILARERSYAKELHEARDAYVGNYPKAGRLFKTSLTTLQQQLDADETVVPDKLAVIRTATPLLQMVADRIHPKKDDQQAQQTNVTVNLSVHQAKELSAPEYVVESEEVEVLATEVPDAEPDP